MEEDLSTDVSTTDSNKTMEDLSNYVNEALASHTVNHATTDPDFKDIQHKFPSEWNKINSIYLGEIAKLKHIILKFNREYQALHFYNLQLKNEINNLKKEIIDIQKNQDTTGVVSFNGVKAKVMDIVKIIGVGLTAITILVVIVFMLAVYSPNTFDQVVNAIDKFVNKPHMQHGEKTTEVIKPGVQK